MLFGAVISKGGGGYRLYYKNITARIRWWILYEGGEKERDQEWVFELNIWIGSDNIILENIEKKLI